MRLMIILGALLMFMGSVYQWKYRNEGAAGPCLALVLLAFSFASLLTGGEADLPFWVTVIAAILVGVCGGRMYFLAAKKHENIRRPLIVLSVLLIVMSLSVCVSTFLMK